MKRSIVAAATAALLLASLAPGARGGVPGEVQLLPDLRPQAPTQLGIDRHDKQVWLEFNTDVLNEGAGPLELMPEEADCDENGDPTDDRLAMQQLFEDTNESGVFERASDVPQATPAGCQHFHPEHNHWHFDDFGSYKLLKIKSDGNVRRPAVARADKVTFCMVDTFGVMPGLPGYSTTRYYPRKPNGDSAPDCLKDATTGISIGWVDRYAHDLVGQELPIGGLPDGFYCLRMRTDALNNIHESNDANNLNSLRVRLRKIDESPGMSFQIPPDERCRK